MVLHGLKRIFQKPTPDLSSSERTNQLRSKTIYSGTVNLSTALAIPGSNRYKTYNGPFEVVNDNGNSSLVASASYSDLLDITKGKVLSSKLPLTDSSFTYYEKNFGNGEMYVGNYQQFDGSVFNAAGPTGCHNSVLVYDMSTTGFTGPGSYISNSIGNTGPSGTVGSNQAIFVDPKHCYYSDPCASSASYMKFVDIDFKGPTGQAGATGITGASQYYAQKIINGDQYSGFRFPMSNFSLITCAQQNQQQVDGPIFCPPESPSLSGFSLPPQLYSPTPIQLNISPPQSNSGGAITYSSSNPSAAFISGPNLDMVTIIGAGTFTITAFQAAYGNYSSGSTTAPLIVAPASPSLTPFTVPSQPFGAPSFQITTPPQSNSTGDFSYTSNNPSIAFSGNTVTITGVDAGTYTITATQAATSNYSSGNTSTPFIVNLASPSLHSFTVPSQPFGVTSFQILTPPQSESTGAFSYTSNNPSIVFSDNNVTMTGVNAGTYTITATQSQAGNYTSGTIDAPFIVALASPSLHPFTVPSQLFGAPSFQITPPPQSNSTGDFSYTSNNTSIVFSGNNVTITGVDIGTYTITATQSPAGNYSSGDISTQFTVNPASPNLSLSLPTVYVYTSPFSLSPHTSTSSSAPVSYSIDDSSIATINGNMITILGVVGTTTVTASQVTYGNYIADNSQTPLTVSIHPTLFNIYSQDAATATYTPYGIFPKVSNLEPGITLYGGTVYYQNASISEPLVISFGYVNQGTTLHTESFTITQTTGPFDFTFNPPLVWTWQIQYSIDDPTIPIWPDVSWSQTTNSSFERYYVLGDPSYESRWVGTLTAWTNPTPP